jgi:phage gp45-like
VVLDDGSLEITVSHSSGHHVTLNAGGQVQIQANSTVEVTASAVNVHAPIATFDGVVQCTTLIASSSVVSPSYTPGAGNVW